MDRPTVEFPRGTYYAVLWGLEVDHGGMTNALLHRSRAFVRAGVPVTVVTYEHQEDLDEVRAALRARGSLVDGIDVVNMWEDLRSWDDDRLRRALDSVNGVGADQFEPLDDGDEDSTPFRAQAFGDDGVRHQADYFRADGTMLLSHRTQVPGEHGVRVHLCDTSGQPIGHWYSIRAFYRFWLDSLPRDPIAYFMVDSKTAANHYPEYRREDAVTIYVVHGSHIASGATSPHGDLSAGRAHSFERLGQYDAAVFLTDRQRRDVQAKLGPLDHLYVCPNGRDVDRPLGSAKDRRKPVGITMGALVRGKRFEQAIAAVAKARKRGARRTRLTMFGHGVKEQSLREKVRRKKLGRVVTFGGYTSMPKREFASASFCLLTSDREGFGLVVVEAMVQGCVPIAYDIDYGPSDVITHGVDGFLVPSGDVDAMASAIAGFCRMSRQEQSAVREAAMRRAQDFDDSVIVGRWSTIVSECSADKRAALGANS